MADPVIILLYNLHVTIFFEKPYFFLPFSLIVTKKNSGPKSLPRGEPILLDVCFVVMDSQGGMPKLHPSRLSAAVTSTRE
jgi:hypothetical protein